MVTEAQYRRREKKAAEEWRSMRQPHRSVVGSWREMIYETFSSPQGAIMSALIAHQIDELMSSKPLNYESRLSSGGFNIWVPVCSKQ